MAIFQWFRPPHHNDVNQERLEVVKNVTKLYKNQPTWRGVAFSGSQPFPESGPFIIVKISSLPVPTLLKKPRPSE